MFIFKNLENLANAFPVIKVKSVSRRFFMAAALSSVLVSACDGSSGGSSGTGSKGESDTTPPGVMENLEAYASVNQGEEVRLRWVSSGDDAWTGSPDHFILAYSANPINSETDWQNGDILGTVNADGPAGTQYDMHLPCPAGDFYFSIKAVDEAGNKSPVSNSPDATIESKPEFYVDWWLPGGGFNLNYNESFLVIRGDAGNGIDSNVDALAQILINTDDSNGIPFANYATWQDIRDVLLQYTDGQPVIAINSELIDAIDATKLNGFMKYICEILTYNPGTGNFEYKSQTFNDLTQSEWDAIYDIHRSSLLQIVNAFPEDYGNLDPSHAPDW